MASGLALIIDDHAAEAVEPGKVAFHDPTLGHRHEAPFGGWRPTGYVILPAQGLHLPRKTPLIRLVCQHTT